VSARFLAPPGPPRPGPAAAHGTGGKAAPEEELAGLPGGPALTVLARAVWPPGEGAQPRPVPGFVVSSFSPLVAELAERCLRGYFGAPPADPARGGRTGVLLASVSGDIATAAAVAQAAGAGRRVPPMLFYQSSPNAVVGYVSARWGLAGPVVCTSPAGDATADAISGAASLIADGDAAAVLVIVAEQAPPGGGAAGHAAAHDHGLAMLIGPRSWPPARAGE
jgi:beta-ketoacyl synthase-like protein